MTDEPLKLAVFGRPVDHSLSPDIHRMFGQQLKRQVDYQAIESAPGELAGRLEDFRQQGGAGVNLTLPLKQDGLKLCIQVDPPARQAHAVNTLKRVDGGWQGFNTDGGGLLLDFDRLGIDPCGARILIVGAGGAVAGILGPLLEFGPDEVWILNRTSERAERLADKFAHRGNVHAGSLGDGPGDDGFDLLIQSTSVGHNGGLPLLNRRWLGASAIVYDLNYGPAHQPLARWAAAHELRCHDGLGMLVGQAALAFEIWTGQRPDIAPVLAALREGTG